MRDGTLKYFGWFMPVVALLSASSTVAQPPEQGPRQKGPAHEVPAMPTNPPATWLTYHLAHPAEDVATGDPNAAFFWKGRYHLFYIAGVANSAGQVSKVPWAHVSSEDMVRWRWHPTKLSPRTMGHGLFSGTGFFTKEGTPAIIYHGEGTGRNWVSLAEDDLLETWSKPVAVEPLTPSGEMPEMRHWDPDCWLNGEIYYAVSGGRDPHLMKSSDLKQWEYLGRLLHDEMPDVGVPRDEDISCPNMFKIGDQWMLLNLSHWLGCRYYLGYFQNEKYMPTMHGRMCWFCDFQGSDEDANLFAPESVLTPDGRRVMWAWSRVKHRLNGIPIQGAIQSLPRELRLSGEGVLSIRPLRELETLRANERAETIRTISGDTVHRLERISGDRLEIEIGIRPGNARQFGINVYCDAEGNHGLPIVFEPAKQTLTVGETRVPLELEPTEDLQLRVFLDKSIIEVFANQRQAALAPHRIKPGNLGVALFSKGGTVQVQELRAWDMRSIYEGASTYMP